MLFVQIDYKVWSIKRQKFHNNLSYYLIKKIMKYFLKNYFKKEIKQ